MDLSRRFADGWCLVAVAVAMAMGLSNFALAQEKADDATVEKMGQLNWHTNAGKAIDDAARGLAVRSWANQSESGGKTDLYILWPEPQEELVAVDVYFAWRNFPTPRLTKGEAYYDPDYLKAIFENETAQTKRLRIEGDAIEGDGKLVDRWSQNGPIDYWYVKVVGVTADGRFIDVKEVSVGGRAYREDPRWHLPPAPPDEECVEIVRPEGSRSVMTRWEPYGETWKKGHEPEMPPRRIAPADAPVAEKVGVLNWNTNLGRYQDDGLGTVLRVWNNEAFKRGNEDLFIHIGDQGDAPEAKYIDIWLSWRNFAPPRLTKGEAYYDPDYIQAIFDNRAAQSKRIRVDSAVAKEGWLVDRVADNGRIGYWYIKLVGVTDDGRFFDIRNWSVGSKSDRQKPEFELERAPDDSSIAGEFDRIIGNGKLKTRWEPYGWEWAEGHEPPRPVRHYPDGDASIVEKMAALNWNARAGKSQDDAWGTALRVWDTGKKAGKDDLYLTWDPNQGHEFEHIDIYLAWRNFPVPRFTEESTHFDPEYLTAIFENRAAQTKRTRVPYPPDHALVDRTAENGLIDYKYVKLVGVTPEGRMIDIKGWSAADAERRADPQWKLPPTPENAAPFERVQGDAYVKTRWEPYGTSWAEGHEPPKVVRSYPPGSAPLEEKLGALVWETNQGLSRDDGKATSLRNWEQGHRGDVDIIVMWEEQRFELERVHALFAWRNFPPPRLTTGAAYFDPDYLRAIWANETAQTKHLALDVATVPDRVFKITPGDQPEHRWYYLKLIGETADGKLVDMEGWSLGSAAYRKDPRWKLPAPPAGDVPKVEQPQGSRYLKTEWEPIGHEWAEGHEPARAVRNYPPGDAPIEARLGALNWENNAGKSIDDGKGTVLANWEVGNKRGRHGIYFMWEEQRREPVKIHVLWAWRNFPPPRLTTGADYYEPEYLRAIWSNETAQTKHLEIEVTRVPDRVFLDARTPHKWSQAKLIGETADGTLFDIEGWSLGSAPYRSDPQFKLPPAPEGKVPRVTRPRGDANLKTKWEPYGTKFARGHERVESPKLYPPGDAELAIRLGALEWNTNGGKVVDDERGTALRNWEQGSSGDVDIYFVWAEQRFELVKIHVFYAWRNFPPPRLTEGARHWDPEYITAIWNNETAQSKHLVIDIEDVPNRCFVDPGTERQHEWKYAKLAGETADGQIVDIVGWSLGSQKYRQRNRLPSLPPGADKAFEVSRPDGDAQTKTRWEKYGNRWAPGHEPGR